MMRAALQSFFILYIFLLVKVILFKGAFFFRVVSPHPSYQQHTANSTYHLYNLVPLHTILSFMRESDSPKAIFFNVFGNILLFVPFGFFLPLVFKRSASLKLALVLSALLSLSFELYQLLTHTGQFDVDDILLNTTGGLAGYFLFLGLRKLWPALEQ